MLALAAIPAIYLFAALVGSLVAVNRGWTEPEQGITIYLADNGIHSDIIMPARVGSLDWAPLVPKERFRGARPRRALGRLRLGRGARLSRNAALARHQAEDDLVRRWPAASE